MPIVPLSEFLGTANGRHSPLDYLIVGGGTAGLVTAHRLSERLDLTIGVIEAGAHHGLSGSLPAIDTPGLIGRTLNNPSYDWAFQSVPQLHAKNRVLPLPRGKGIGGSTLINYLGLTRPSKQEYDTLETTFENDGWNWDKLLECMKKAERFSPSRFAGEQSKNTPVDVIIDSSSVHGTQGPIHHSHPSTWPPHDPLSNGQRAPNFAQLFFQSLGRLGVPENPEPLSGNNIGYSKPLMTIDPVRGIRSSATSGYFEPIMNTRKNLLVLTGGIVTRVLFEKSSPSGEPRAIGVEMYIPEEKRCVEVRNVRREVILSAGTLKTPQILECSGIGNPTLLQEHGIECVVDLPGVGENLQDHIGISLIVEIDPKYTTGDVLLDPAELQKQQKLYDEKKEGMLAGTPFQGAAFLPLHLVSEVNGGSASTKLENLTNRVDTVNKNYLQSLNLAQPLRQGLEKQYKIQLDWLSRPDQAQIEIINFQNFLPINGLFLPGSSGMPGERRFTSLTTAVMHPFSRGSVHLASGPSNFTKETGPSDPKIDLNVLSNPNDAFLLLQGIEYILHLTQTQPLKGALRGYVFPAELGEIDLGKALEDPEIHSEASLNPPAKERLGEILEAHMRNWVRTTYHPVGTAAMMSREDGGVVDSRLRVYGVNALRVVDLSVLPFEISSHTVSAAYAIGEMASQIILQGD